jgi:type IV pilus assembly protein PilM
MNSFAVDISDRSIKYGELIITPRGLCLNKYNKVKIDEGIVVSGKIEKENELVVILKKIKEKENLHFIRVSLPEEQMYLFTLSLPKTENKNLRDMILLQIEEHIPLKAPDSLFDFNVIKEDNQNMLVEVVAIANVTIESYLSVFQKAGLVPISFELEAQALARAVIPKGDNSTVMIVDFGDAKTVISISSNERVFFTTTLAIGGIDLTNMISKNFSLSFKDAEKMKHEYGLDNGSKAEDIFPAILNGLSVLRDELNKQYVYWSTRNKDTKDNKIDRIILCGGDANLAGLSDYLGLSMKVKVENANVWVNILDTEIFIPEMSLEESLSYATVLGLSLGGYMDKTKSIINILPQREKEAFIKEYWMRFSVILLNLIALVGFFAVVLLSPLYFLSQLKENLIQTELDKFNIENPNQINNSPDKMVSDINSKLKVLSMAENKYQINETVIKNILSSYIDGITFSQILFNKQSESLPKTDSLTLEIRGVAKDRDSLRNFKTVLDKNPNFLKVDLPISNFLEKSDLVFNVKITLK